MEHYYIWDYNGTKLNNMMKNEKKDSNLPCHTTDPRGRGKGWVEGGVVELDETGENFNFTAPQVEPLHVAIVWDRHCFVAVDRADFVSLFIGHYYYRLA
jgi:hypothetical protein